MRRTRTHTPLLLAIGTHMARQALLEATPPPPEDAANALGEVERLALCAEGEAAALDRRLAMPDPRERLDGLVMRRAQARRIAAAMRYILERETRGEAIRVPVVEFSDEPPF